MFFNLSKLDKKQTMMSEKERESEQANNKNVFWAFLYLLGGLGML